MVSIKSCPFCGKEILDISFFCSFCGKQVKEETDENELRVSERIGKSFQKTVSSFKQQAAKLLANLEQKVDNSTSLSFVNKQRISNLFNQFQDKDQIEIAEATPEISEWATLVEEAISGEKCIICLQEFKIDDQIETKVILCPECNYAGHVKHFIDWLDKKKTCPMCRSELDKSKLLRGFLTTKDGKMVFSSWEKSV
ncbi:MAG: RING finger domain-containing protein [Candidatus Heimdallarchaeaceae archaeon]